MGGAQNRKRKRRIKRPDKQSLWGYLFHKETPPNDITRGTLYTDGEEEDDTVTDNKGLLLELWGRFNPWTVLAITLFLAFLSCLILVVVRMWQPQALDDIAGYNDKAPAKDLSVLIRNANGATISFSEGELNRYLRNTCRTRQTGIFSIFANAQGVAVRIHDGYAELIVDRLVGANMHQTTAVNLTFYQQNNHGRPELKVDFKGGEPLMGNMPRGGQIGMLGVPQKHMQALQPALKTLLDCYPDIFDAIKEHGYCPVFKDGDRNNEGRITLIPYSSQ